MALMYTRKNEQTRQHRLPSNNSRSISAAWIHVRIFLQRFFTKDTHQWNVSPEQNVPALPFFSLTTWDTRVTLGDFLFPVFSKRRWNEFPLIAGLLAARELRERMETNYFSQAGTDDRSLSCVGIDFINTANQLPVWLPRRETTGRLIKPGDGHFNLSTFIRSLYIPDERHRDVSQTKQGTPLATVTSVRLFELHTRVQV